MNCSLGRAAEAKAKRAREARRDLRSMLGGDGKSGVWFRVYIRGGTNGKQGGRWGERMRGRGRSRVANGRPRVWGGVIGMECGRMAKGE